MVGDANVIEDPVQLIDDLVDLGGQIIGIYRHDHDKRSQFIISGRWALWNEGKVSRQRRLQWQSVTPDGGQNCESRKREKMGGGCRISVEPTQSHETRCLGIVLREGRGSEAEDEQKT